MRALLSQRLIIALLVSITERQSTLAEECPGAWTIFAKQKPI
jgi:hypothetical protein